MGRHGRGVVHGDLALRPAEVNTCGTHMDSPMLPGTCGVWVRLMRPHVRHSLTFFKCTPSECPDTPETSRRPASPPTTQIAATATLGDDGTLTLQEGPGSTRVPVSVVYFRCVCCAMLGGVRTRTIKGDGGC